MDKLSNMIPTEFPDGRTTEESRAASADQVINGRVPGRTDSSRGNRTANMRYDESVICFSSQASKPKRLYGLETD